MNGVPLDKKHLNGEDFEEELLTEPRKDTQMIQKEVYRGRLSDGMDVLDWLMLVDLVGDRLPSLKTESFSLFDKRSMGATVAKYLNYMVGGRTS